MNLQHLDNSTLEKNFLKAVKTERKIMHIVVQYIQEIQRRQIHLSKSYSSIFEYLIEEAGYSSSAAQRRLEAARLVAELPQVSSKLESGELTLTQIGEIQRSVKQAEKIH